MADVVILGNAPWSRSDMLARLEEFAGIYAERPIRDNSGGMKSAHMFATWFALKMLQPKVIVESGLWLGQGTWLLGQACPDAELHCIDPNLERIQYRSAQARYYQQDFASLDWNHLPKEDTLLFFDDHQNAYERAKTAKWFGFKHLMFEDNYAALHGDVYSFKKAFAHAGFIPDVVEQSAPKTLKARLRPVVLSTLATFIHIPSGGHEGIPPNQADAAYLRQNLEIYYEFPPIFQVEQTRWNDTWDDRNYPTPQPLLTSVSEPYQQIFLDEALDYTWICYAKLT